jgi:hypothetical protein
MAKRPTLNSIGNISTASSTINSNNERIEEAFDNTLSRDGSTPNAMLADLDMNSNDLLNVGTVNATDIRINGSSVSTGLVEAQEMAAASALAADASADAAALSAAEALAKENSMLRWRGPWVTATAYAPSDIVFQTGSAYICVVAHTSGVFVTDLGAIRWELFAQQGAAGAGTGDMLKTENLSGLANVSTARLNLGLAALATKATAGFADLDPAAVRVSTEGFVASNTELPTVTAVRDFVSGEFQTKNINVQSPIVATGTQITFSAIPSWVTRVTILFDSVRRSGTSPIELRIGDVFGIQSTGYTGAVTYYYNIGTLQTVTTGFQLIHNVAATNVVDGFVTLTKVGVNKWAISSGLGFVTTIQSPITLSGTKTLANSLTQLQLTMSNGTDTFNQGNFNVFWE